MKRKTLRFDSLDTWREFMRLTSRRVVATNGCFDLLHRGHVTYLAKAKEMGDVLIVGVNSDRSVRELKGESRPVNTQEDRMAVLAALEVVDYVVIFDETSANNFLAAVQPHVWVKGGDYTEDSLDAKEVATVKECGGEIVIVPVVAGLSTTRCLSLIQAAEAAEPEVQVLAGDFSQRDQEHRPVHSGGAQSEPSEEPGATLRARSSLRPERGVSKSDPE
jgi:rfaE bifunctional protein nucleotidyltransferase chain/domain